VHRICRAGRATIVFASTIALALVAITAPAFAAASRAAARAVPGADPVVLVHGFDGSAASWSTMVNRLRAAGYPADRIEAITYDSHASTIAAAGQLAAAVAALRARTRARRVDIVSHSMGAIVARWYLERLGGTDSVDAFVALAGVNEGTIWAYGCSFYASCREMVPGSAVLTDLGASGAPGDGVRAAAWWSPCDPTIVPAANAQLPGARNTETRCLGHSDVPRDATVFRQVLAFLA
jgi:triacylglycerol lipase